MCITDRSAMENTVHSLWKSKGSFPTASKQHFPQLRSMASYTHFPHAGDGGIQPFPSFLAVLFLVLFFLLMFHALNV